jgi:hypothetical protein
LGAFDICKGGHCQTETAKCRRHKDSRWHDCFSGDPHHARLAAGHEKMVKMQFVVA